MLHISEPSSAAITLHIRAKMSDLPELLDIDAPNSDAAVAVNAVEAEDSDDESAPECEEECVCLLCPARLPSARDAFQHASREHEFDFHELRRKHGVQSAQAPV